MISWFVPFIEVSKAKKSYLEIAIEVTDAGSLLSLRSNAVCIVNLFLNTNCLCHLKPEK